MLLSNDRIKKMMAITSQSVTIGVDSFTISKSVLQYNDNDQLPLEASQAWLFIKSEAEPAPGVLIEEDGTFLVIGSNIAPDETTYKAFVYALPSTVTYTPVTADSYDEGGKKIINAALDEVLKARIDSGVIADDIDSSLLPVQSFIIPTPSVLPVSGCLITVGTKKYDIDNVKEISSASGQVIGWRLTV